MIVRTLWKHNEGGITRLPARKSHKVTVCYRPPIYDGPLALNASVGYKFAEVPRITNDLWILNLRATLAT